MIDDTADEDFLAALEKLSHSNKAIVVEGKRDKAALKALGVRCLIFTINKPLFALAEEIASASTDVIILTDLDKKGKELYGRLSTLLQHLGVRIDNSFREFLFRNTTIRQIEGLRNSSF
jgi:5S rRNA maturation endonuclease (ribonuclease M5)